MTDLSKEEKIWISELKLTMCDKLECVNRMIWSREDRLSDDVKNLKSLHREMNNLIDEINRILYR